MAMARKTSAQLAGTQGAERRRGWIEMARWGTTAKPGSDVERSRGNEKTSPPTHTQPPSRFLFQALRSLGWQSTRKDTMHKRMSSKPEGLGRTERVHGAGRHCQNERTPSEYMNTGVFTGVNGGSATKGMSQAYLAARAAQRPALAKAMREWKRSLPKGVRI